MFNNDREITISTGNSRRSVQWQSSTLYLSEFFEKLRIPARGTETVSQYLALSKGQQDDLKDVGGFVGGSLRGTRRKAGACIGRDVITLDLDNIPPGGTDDILRRVDSLGCSYCIYSTRKHSPAAPRLRVLLPLDHTAGPDEYEPAARKIAELIGLEFADPTTFEILRLMYWPSVCADGEYVYAYRDRPFLSLDGLLAMYEDWHNIATWPRQPCEKNMPASVRVNKLADPLDKKGVIGAFCKMYDIEAAIAAFLPEIYKPSAVVIGRYDYAPADSSAGLAIYDGKWAYSHHATDPAWGKLYNAFDLVRVHLYGALDDDAKPNAPANSLPSYKAMCKFAADLPDVKELMLTDRVEAARIDFEDMAGGDEIAKSDWTKTLAVNPQNNTILPTIDNIWHILENDPNLKDKFALNEFAGQGEIMGPLPWDKRGHRRLWSDNDSDGLYWYFEKYWQITGNGKIDSALSLHSQKHKFNDVTKYLGGLIWDGIPRLDTLFIDYLGAADNLYTRTVTRKAFVAAVARAMQPGCKYDTMLILAGPQGIGKSTVLDTMSRGWFNDSIRTFEGKEASELLPGVWVVEISELEAFRRSDIARIKQFLSLRVDRFRAAYGRHKQELPRRCVFFGTTNAREFLQDDTGNRRFWPVDVDGGGKKNVWDDLPGEIDQLWAEAAMRWQFGEALHLDTKMIAAAEAIQEAHREVDAWEGLIENFLQQQVPEGWLSWPLDRRMLYYAGAERETKLVDRDRICAMEIWLELISGAKKDMTYSHIKKINSAVRSVAGWEMASSPIRCGYCGSQRGFRKSKT